MLYSSAFRDVKSYFSWSCHCCNIEPGTGLDIAFQGVVAAVNDSLCIGVSQHGYSRLSFIPDPQRNKPSCHQSDAGKLCLMIHFLLTVQWAQAEYGWISSAEGSG